MTESTSRGPTETLEDDLEELRYLKATIAEMTERKDELSMRIAEMTNVGQELTYRRGDTVYKATLSRSVRTKVNLLRLHSLAPDLEAMITKPAVDTEKLSASLDGGYWTPSLRDEVITFSVSKPSIRFTEYHHTEGSEDE